MSIDRTQAVLYESEAALRLVEGELTGLHHDDDQSVSTEAVPVLHREGSLAELPALLERANSQIMSVLVRLRESRASIETSALEKLASTHEKIREVTSATEDAAINIMDACDRATQMVDELDNIDAESDRNVDRANEVRGNLRDELFMMMGALQFQDITSQQLAHASAVLVEMEDRLLEVARLFDPRVALPEAVRPVAIVAPDIKTYDPNATTRDSESRQALADEIFTAVKQPA